MTRNPIYHALVTTGMVGRLTKAHRDNPIIMAANSIASRKLDAILDLYELGIIDHAELRELETRAARSYHAAVLRVARSVTTLAKRRGATTTIRRICPPSVTPYDFRMARDVRA